MWSNASAIPPKAPWWAGYRVVVLIAATYVYFLIFAQFGFLKRLDELGLAGDHLKLIMAAMAVGGIASSLLASRVTALSNPAFRMRCALAGCGAAALLTTLPLTVFTGILVSLAIGIALGLLTITLVSNLDLWSGASQPLFVVGLGTGLGYFLCNVPVLFTASPRGIALAAAAVCLPALFATGTRDVRPAALEPSQKRDSRLSFGVILVWFTALIWFDSAAFFIIQNSPALKSGTWEGSAHLWRTGALHLTAALVAAWLLNRHTLALTLVLAFSALAAACLVFNTASPGAAAFFYPVGVSLYSVGLIAAPSFLLRTTSRSDRARKAGWIYAVAGWGGSAMGIGMGQNLHRVPPAFIGTAALIFLAPWLWQWGRSLLPQAAVVLGSVAIAFAMQHFLVNKSVNPFDSSPERAIARGRRVYIAEGCIHCHSQYIRPHSADVLMWGPTQDIEVIRRQQPPLIGNRRQGPDLSEVGSRRSPLWLRMHFIDPRDVSYDSIMPQYSYLFRDGRGEDLIAYAASLKTAGSEQHRTEAIATWVPASLGDNGGSPDGAELFQHYCATCHMQGGQAREKWATSFKRLPPLLTTDPLLYVPAGEFAESRKLRIERIIKFGIPGTDMPGHEYLPDAEVESLATSVTQTIAARAR